MDLVMYSDADQAGDINDRISTTGYVQYLGLNPISWSSKKQTTIARSSIEAEYRAVTSAVAETTWIKNLLFELSVILPKAPIIYCDSIAVT